MARAILLPKLPARMTSATLTVLIALAVGGLLVAESRGLGRAAFFWKTGASLGFVALGISHLDASDGALGRRLVLGLALAAGGDVALAVPGERSFLVGLGLFLLGHAAYVAGFAAAAPLATWTSPLGVVPVVLTAGAYVWLAPSLGSMKLPVIVYMLVITLMVIGAIALRDSGTRSSGLLLAGAVFFYASDLSVARDRFVAPGFVNKAWGLPAYYAGQLLLAWALA